MDLGVSKLLFSTTTKTIRGCSRDLFPSIVLVLIKKIGRKIVGCLADNKFISFHAA